MDFFSEWLLAVHRAVWFPLHWTLGLERPSVEMPAEVAPHLAFGPTEQPRLRVVKGRR